MIREIIILSTLILGLVFIGWVEHGHTHELPISHITIVESDSKIHLELKINAFELAFLSKMDVNDNNVIEKKEFDDHKEIINKKILQALTIELNNTRMYAESSGLMLDMTSHHFVFRAHYPSIEREAFRSLTLISDLQKITDRSHVTKVTCNLSDSKQRARLDARNNTATFNLGEDAKFHTLAGMVYNKQNLWILFSGLLIGITGMYVFKNRN